MKKIVNFKINIMQKFKNNGQMVINTYYFYDEKNYYKYYWCTELEMNNKMENIYNSTTLIDGRYFKTIKQLLKLILTDLNDDSLKLEHVFFKIQYTDNKTYRFYKFSREDTLNTFQSIFKVKKGGESIANSNKHQNS